MMQILFAERFFEDMDLVELPSKQDEILNTISLLSSVPEMGSRRVPASIIDEFGPQVRKLVVKPFLVVYEIDSENQALRIHGLVHQRQAV